MSSVVQRTRRLTLALFNKKDEVEKKHRSDDEREEVSSEYDAGGTTLSKSDEIKPKKRKVKAPTEESAQGKAEVSDTSEYEGEGRERRASIVGRLRSQTLGGIFNRGPEQVLDPSEMEGPAEKTGYMFKEGGSWKSWKERWCILKGAKLYYREKENSKDVLGVINLIGIKLRLEERYTNPEFEMRTCIVFAPKEASKTKQSRTYYFFTEKSIDTNKWVEAMQRSVKRVLREERRRRRAELEGRDQINYSTSAAPAIENDKGKETEQEEEVENIGTQALSAG